uniref:Putative secreted peptide n=1 Tax=Anopheles braziliensis TaxID=58242 RepID=A0A2M3ZNU6_9DIPT
MVLFFLNFLLVLSISIISSSMLNSFENVSAIWLFLVVLFFAPLGLLAFGCSKRDSNNGSHLPRIESPLLVILERLPVVLSFCFVSR